ncbi:MAG: hypothetical protein CL915_04845 [Deltaproteobacteria bacterium]|nr:hypothetical protein [Deltaproteobacteria bacterium]
MWKGNSVIAQCCQDTVWILPNHVVRQTNNIEGTQSNRHIHLDRARMGFNTKNRRGVCLGKHDSLKKRWIDESTGLLR